MKAKITSGVMYRAVIKDETERAVKFVADDNGTLWTWNDDNKAVEIPAVSIKNMSDIQITYDDFTMAIDDNGVYRMWPAVMYLHEGDYYTREDALESIYDDDDLFREYVDENAGYVQICNHSYYTDYDTLSDWGILDDIREDWNDDIESMLDNGDFGDWDLIDNGINDTIFYILDNGTLINSAMVDKDMVAELISIVMDSCATDNRIGDWIINRAPIEINDVNTNVTTPTINPDSERPISLA